MSPTPPENMYGFVLRMRTQLSLWLHKDLMAHLSGPGTSYSLSASHKVPLAANNLEELSPHSNLTYSVASAQFKVLQLRREYTVHKDKSS